MKQQNRFDLFIENLADEFSKIKDFHLTQEDAKAKKLFNFIIKRIVEIQSFKTLFIHYYLPAASKAVVTDLAELNKSKYKNLIQISKEDLKENYYDTIRLAYIGMFHKYENFVDDLIIHAEFVISDIDNSEKVSLKQYVKQTFGYDIKDWKNSQTISRLNWICNCNKHYDGFPRKGNKPKIYEHLSENEKMKFSKENFTDDIDILINHYIIMLRAIFMLALHKMLCFGKNFEVEGYTNMEAHQKLIHSKNILDEKVKMFLKLI